MHASDSPDSRPLGLALLALGLVLAAAAAVLGGLVGHLADGAVVVVERSGRAPEPVWPQGLARFDARAYGETAVWFAEPEPAAAATSDPGGEVG